MRIVSIHATKTHLSRLVEQAAAGEEIIIAKSGKPVARLCRSRGCAHWPIRRVADNSVA